MTVVSWCACVGGGAHIAIRGRLVGIVLGTSNHARDLHVACVKCGRAQLPDGSIAELVRQEHLALSTLALPITYARDAINRRIQVDPLALPTVEQLSELGLVRPIRSETFRDFREATDDEVRSHMRGLFEIPDGTSAVRLKVAGLGRALIVGDEFVEHPLQQQRRRDDPDHMRYSVLSPNTVLETLEMFLVRTVERGLSFKFLAAYRDLSIPAESGRSPYVYHVAYALGNGCLTTSFRLRGGAQAFRAEREGRLLYASYAAPIVPVTAELVIPASKLSSLYS